MTEQGFEKRFIDIMSQYGNGAEVSRLAQDFYTSVHTGHYTWIGLVESEDELKRITLEMYLREGSPDVIRNLKYISISDPYAKLSLKLRPGVFLHLYHIPPFSENLSLAELVVEATTARLRSTDHQPNSTLLFEETIIPRVFYQSP